MKFLALARKINDLWSRCLGGNGILKVPSRCPTDEEIAAIIEADINSSTSSSSDSNEDNSSTSTQPE